MRGKVIAIVLAALTLLFVASPAYATDPPDSINVDYIYANRNLLESGDILIYARYNIEYGSTPDDPVSDTYIFRIIDSGGNEIAINTAYPFVTSGYGEGIIAWYFPPETAPTWGDSYTIRISGNPAAFADPPLENFSIDGSAWSTYTSATNNRNETAQRVLTIAKMLEIAWSPVELITTSQVGQVFSDDGEIYFTNAIVGIQGMAPTLFSIQYAAPDFSKTTWDTSQASTYEARYSTSDLGTSLDDYGGLFGWHFAVTGSIFMVVIAILLIILGNRVALSSTAGVLASVCAVLMAALMGWMPTAMMAVGSLFCVLYIGYRRFFASG